MSDANAGSRCDPNPKRATVARDVIGVPGCPRYTNFDEMLERPIQIADLVQP